MNRFNAFSLSAWFCLIFTLSTWIDSIAAEVVTLENVTDPGENRRDEPISQAYSWDKAVTFLDSAALSWQKQ